MLLAMPSTQFLLQGLLGKHRHLVLGSDNSCMVAMHQKALLRTCLSAAVTEAPDLSSFCGAVRFRVARPTWTSTSVASRLGFLRVRYCSRLSSGSAHNAAMAVSSLLCACGQLPLYSPGDQACSRYGLCYMACGQTSPGLGNDQFPCELLGKSALLSQTGQGHAWQPAASNTFLNVHHESKERQSHTSLLAIIAV